MKGVSTLSDRKNFDAIDIFKFICALLVVSIHISVYFNINGEISYFITQILARVAVPFFFICSGFFLGSKIYDFSKVIKYIKRIFSFYIIYTLLYLPIIIRDWISNDVVLLEDIKFFIKNLFLVGSYIHLWYFLASLVAVILLYVSVVKFKFSDKVLLITSGFLYIIGVLGEAYRNIFILKFDIIMYLSKYYRVFTTTRNGLFFGFLFLSIGYLVYKHRSKIKNNLNLYTKYALLTFVLYSAEEYFARGITMHSTQDMLFTTPIVSLFIFLVVCFTDVPSKYKKYTSICRKSSVLIFGFHLLVMDLLYNVIKLNISGYLLYFVTVLFSVLLSYLLIKLQEKKYLKFIKYLY